MRLYAGCEEEGVKPFFWTSIPTAEFQLGETGNKSCIEICHSVEQ